MAPKRSTEARGLAVTLRGGTDADVGGRQHCGGDPVMVQA